MTIILDGFGLRDEEKGNAIKAADMKTFKRLWDEYPHSSLYASEEYVGLHKGQFGNSETGHLTIGAGRLIKQNETLVNEFLDSNVLENEKFQELLMAKDKDIHIMGLLSDGNVHAGIDDFIKLYQILVKNGFKKIHFHIITDGRDTGVKDAYKYIEQIIDLIKNNKVGDIATIAGRYYAMDRDRNFERTKVYYDLVTRGIGINNNDIKDALDKMYAKDITDEFIRPIVINQSSLIKNGDVLIWMNYRADRAKQILSSFVDVSFEPFKPVITDLDVYSFLPIDKNIPTKNFIDEVDITNPLGLYLEKLELTQARIAETEKFPHVTYFFDGGYSGKISKCNQFLIPSPKVATYDLKPEMSALKK